MSSFPKIPTGAQVVTVGHSAFYYACGAFYGQEPTGFAVVPAPPGAVVNAPPPGAIPLTVNGELYCKVGNTYYEPAVVGGTTLYTTVKL